MKFFPSVNYLTPLDQRLNYFTEHGRMGRPCEKCRLVLSAEVTNVEICDIGQHIRVDRGPVRLKYRGSSGTYQPVSSCSRDGDCFIAIDPSLFREREEFTANVTRFCKDLRMAKPVDPARHRSAG